MAFISWDSKLTVGVKIIDEQHKTLVELVNRLHDAMASGQGKMILGNILSELIGYTQSHFSTEEQLMHDHAYVYALGHEAEHRKLVKDVAEFKQKFDHGNATLSVAMLNFLCNWLQVHIQESDKRLGEHLVSKGVH